MDIFHFAHTHGTHKQRTGMCDVILSYLTWERELSFSQYFQKHLDHFDVSDVSG